MPHFVDEETFGRESKILPKAINSKWGALLIPPWLHSTGAVMVAQRRKTFAHSHKASSRAVLCLASSSRWTTLAYWQVGNPVE